MGDLAVCLACEHVHGSPSIAYICVGCPCPHYPVGQDDWGRWLDCGGCGEPWPCYTAVRHDDPPSSASYAAPSDQRSEP